MSIPKSKSVQFALRRSPRLLGMRNPQSISSQFALRRSSRLLEKSSINKPQQRSRIKPRKPRKPLKSRYHDVGPTTYTGNHDIEGFMRMCRKIKANEFRLLYSHANANNIMELKTIISPDGTSSRLDKSFGFTWVAVHGMISISVAVIWDKNLLCQDVPRFTEFIKSRVFRLFATTVLSEMEDLADSSIESCQTFDRKRFAVVPMILSTTDVVEEGGHEASTAVSNAESAVKFLQEKMKSDIAFARREETTQIAISALQHLVHKKFKADDIQVAVLLKRQGVEHLSACKIERYLAVINEPGSGGSGSSGSSDTRSAIADVSDVE